MVNISKHRKQKEPLKGSFLFAQQTQLSCFLSIPSKLKQASWQAGSTNDNKSANFKLLEKEYVY